MSDAVQSKIGNRKSKMRKLINGLFAEWPKISVESHH